MATELHLLFRSFVGLKDGVVYDARLLSWGREEEKV